MAKQNIDFGAFPNDPAADPIRAAFQKVQNNFDDLYSKYLSTGVSEINAGAGLAQSASTGNISISANISSITIKTSGWSGSTNSLRVGVVTTPSSNTATISQYNTPFTIDLAPNITTVNANFTGSLFAANFSLSGVINSSLIPGANQVYNLGSPTRRWKDIFLSGNSISLGDLTMTSPDGTYLLVPAVTVSGPIDAGTISAGTIAGNLTSAVQPNITSVGTLQSLQVASSITAASMSITGSFQAGTIYGNVVLPPGATIQAPGADTQLIFNDSGVQQAVAGMTFNKTTNLLTIQGNITGANIVSGNATFTGNIGVNKVVASGDISSNGSLTTLGIVSTTTGINTGLSLSITNISGNGTVVTVTFDTQASIPFSSGTTITIVGVTPTSYNGSYTVVSGTTSQVTFNSTVTATASFVGATIKGNGNTTINGLLQVVGNTSFGNITAVNAISGNIITVSGNVDSGNLISQGILRVSGTANVGALISAGDSNVANSLVRGNFTSSGSTALFAGATTITNSATVTGLLTASGNATVTGYINATGNMSSGGSFTASGNISGTNLNASGTLSGGNLSTPGTVTATGNVAGGNFTTTGVFTGKHVYTSGDVSATGLLTGGNVTTSGVVTASGNVIGANFTTAGIFTGKHLYTSGDVVATGLLTGGNVTTSGIITASGNVIAGNVSTAGNFYSLGLIASGAVTAASLAATGNVSAANLVASGLLSAGNLSTPGRVTATGNIAGGNISTAGVVNALHLYPTGNISMGGAFYTNSFANVASYMIVGGNLTTSGLWANLGGHANVNGTVYASGFNFTGGNLLGGNSSLSGSLIATGGANIANLVVNSFGSVVGNIFQAQMFTGNGANITFVNAANVSGIVSNAAYSSSAGSATTSLTADRANNIALGSYSNITGVGTLISLNVSGDFASSTGNVGVGGYLRMSVSAGITAAGSTQATATILTKTINVITSTVSGTGVQLPAATVGQLIYIINDTNTGIVVYPSSGQYIDALAQNAGFTVGAYGRMQFVAATVSKYYSMTSIYA